MSDANLVEIKEKITAQHGGDERQLDVIFSDNKSKKASIHFCQRRTL